MEVTMSKQTAVEWCIEQRDKLRYDYHFEGIGILKYFERKKDIEVQAKQMEKEQIIGAANNGCKGRCMIDTSRDGKQYYNETYGGQDE